MKLADVTTGRRARPQKIMIYGVEGIGKSTFGSHFPKPIFLDVEDRTAHLDIHRLAPATWTELRQGVESLQNDKHEYETVVVDTADWAETLASQDVCQRFNKTGIEDFGYGKGFQYVRESMQDLLRSLHNLQHQRGMHVVVLAHARITKFDDPQQAVSYDRFTLKCHDKVSAMLREWVDAVLFANYNTIVETGQDKVTRAKAGNRRMLYTNHTAAYDAKNSYGLPDELPMEYERLRPYIEGGPAAPAAAEPPASVPTAPAAPPPKPSQEELAEKKRLQEIAVSLASPLGGIDYVKKLLNELNLTFKTMSVPECAEFVEDVRARVTEEMIRRNGGTPHA